MQLRSLGEGLLRGLDSDQDTMLQRHVCYHYITPQNSTHKGAAIVTHFHPKIQGKSKYYDVYANANSKLWLSSYEL